MRKKIRSIRRMLALFLIILSLLVCILTLTKTIARSPQRRRKLAAWLMQKHLRGMVRVCGLQLHVRGSLPAAGENVLLLSNHVSYWDILALGSLFPLAFIAKDSIAAWPVLGRVTSLCNTIYVSRDRVPQRWKALRQLQRNVSALSYCVFPEGTTTASPYPKLSLWHRGNIAVLRDPGCPVWLAGLHYRGHENQAWIDDDALLPHLFSTLQEPSIDLVIQLQKLEAAPDAPLQQVSIAAWTQTVGLCKRARDEVSAWPAPCPTVRNEAELQFPRLFTGKK